MQILQVSTAVPRNKYSTQKLLQMFPCELPDGVKQNILNLGVSARYLVDSAEQPVTREKALDETSLVDLCVEACQKTIEKVGVSINDVGFFVAAYDISPFLCPGISQLLVRKVGLSPYVKHVNAQGMACTAFPIALELARNHLAAHPRDKVLLCVSGVNSYGFQNQVHGINDVMEISQISKLKNRTRRSIELRKWIAAMEFFLFGDGVAAAIVAKKDGGLQVKKTLEVTNIRKKDYLAGFAKLAALNEPFRFGLYSHLDKNIPKLGIKYTGTVLRKLLKKDFDTVADSAKKWAFHTGSEKILNELAEHYHITRGKLEESYEVLKNYGNLAAASLPFILEKIAASGKLAPRDTVLMVGYGWGFAASAALLQQS